MTTNFKATETAKPPFAKLRQGLLYANIWKRTNSGRVYYSVTFERRYTDKTGVWHSTRNFSASDLLLLADLAERANVQILNLYSTVE